MAPVKKTKKTAPRFATQARQELSGSHKAPFVFSPEAQSIPATGRLTVSVVVKRKTPLAPKTFGKVRVTRAEYAKNHGADKADIKLIHAFAAEFGLIVAKNTPRPERRTILLTGSVANMQKAFGIELKQVTTPNGTFRIREGAICIPSELNGSVVAVLGLDNRPQAFPHFRVRKQATPASGIRPNAAAGASYTPVEVAALYNFPTTGAAGQTIGIIELGGGYTTADITAYFSSIGVQAPSVTTVAVDGGGNTPSGPNGADGEVMLDIEVAGAVAPGAKIVVYFAPNTDQGFIDAIAAAVHDTTNKPSVISISWGGPESSWTQQSLTALDQACQSAAALGVTITVAAGDNGSTDGTSSDVADFPASSPHVLACGGTTLEGSGGAITSEVVWNETASNEGATGGGVSTVFALPSWQSGSNVPAAPNRVVGRGGPPVAGPADPAPPNVVVGRGVPDGAGDADPVTGYTIRVDGQTLVIGGTSAVAPLWAGLIAVINAAAKTSAGFLQPTLYSTQGTSAFRDITSGNNGTYSAGPGWDACTGLGSPIGGKLLALLGGPTPTAPTPSPTPTPTPTPAPPKKPVHKKPVHKKPVHKKPTPKPPKSVKVSGAAKAPAKAAAKKTPAKKSTAKKGPVKKSAKR